MSNRYAPLPNPRTDPENTEMEAAFDDTESDDDQDSESHPMISTSTPSSSLPGTYDFEAPAYDYDFPPPGSPPAPSTIALPNNHGNSNGVVPVFSLDTTPQPPRTSGWFRRTAASVLPSHYVHRWGILPARPSIIGGGTNNDGVFANVTAKPSRGIRVQDGDDVHFVPEETSRESPPSYATAQADAAPPYFSTTILAPFSLSSSTPGSVVVDALPTGTLFAFCWNALISVSFQFIGFLLTYLMHTTHAARLGSRAGLGVTLIQYGFGLRARMEDAASGGGDEGWDVKPTFASVAEAEAYLENQANSTGTATPTQLDASVLVANATTEWLSFFLMTIGWFILLTSALGFWRVKRWEQGILASAGSGAGSMDVSGSGEERSSVDGSLPFLRFARSFSGHFQRRGETEREVQAEVEFDAEGEDEGGDGEGRERRPLITREEILADPERARRLRAAIAAEQRLHNDLRAAGLL
ncbi:hypothetical protein BV22DRAFT_1078559 [Leucogyrophana mollusca]|uniref:Uncharacterized protein n=1 Tax=Leucogyrophana mollusca TaxID=85980 RepID=A0ACB8BXP6_9AGAM|nr:hypothetical protein BV22DRAFT_1078559 [Leucogyrophana mollusca]